MKTAICHRCNRKLTNPKSVRRGYGPVCFKKVRKSLRLREIFAEIQPYKRELMSSATN